MENGRNPKLRVVVTDWVLLFPSVVVCGGSGTGAGDGDGGFLAPQ